MIDQKSKAEYDRLDGCNFDRDFEDLVASAALAHDLGQPPFGHAGERTLARKTGTSGVTFDANKQNVRLLLGSEAREPLEVSAALIDAVIKYKDIPCFSEAKRPGFYKFEQEAIARITADNGTGLNKRHPACFLMEAADDIAYIAGDIEDVLKVGILDRDHFAEKISLLPVLDDDYNQASKNWNELLKECSSEQIASALLKSLISHAIDGLRESVSGVSLGDIPDKMHKFYLESSLDKMNILYWKGQANNTGTANAIKGLKDKTYQNGVLKKVHIAEAERLAEKVVNDLFDSLMDLTRKGYASTGIYAMVPEHVQKAVDKLHQQSQAGDLGPIYVADYISGMTDRFALDFWERLHQPSRLKFVG